MPNWTSRPDRGDTTAPVTILRAQPGPGHSAIVTTDTVLGTYTHYYKGRTKPCEGPTCEPCLRMMSARWYGYLGVWHPKSNSIAILEITPTTMVGIDAYEAIHGTLRGAKITVARANRKINSRLILTIEEGNFSADKIPAAPNVAMQLCKLWEVVQPIDHGVNHSQVADFLSTRRNGHAL